MQATKRRETSQDYLHRQTFYEVVTERGLFAGDQYWSDSDESPFPRCPLCEGVYTNFRADSDVRNFPLEGLWFSHWLGIGKDHRNKRCIEVKPLGG